MDCLDPGHRYRLNALDGKAIQELTFVKREGNDYPFNIGHYSGTTCQEVLRALIERAKYLQMQAPCGETEGIIAHLRQSLWLFESRAARRHGRYLLSSIENIENMPTCSQCGHIACELH